MRERGMNGVYQVRELQDDIKLMTGKRMRYQR